MWIGALAINSHADGRRQMIDLVDVGHQAADQRLVGGRAADVAELEVAAHGSQVFRRAGRLVVQHGHVIIARQQGFGQMATDKARPAGNQSMLHNHTRISRLPALASSANVTRVRALARPNPVAAARFFASAGSYHFSYSSSRGPAFSEAAIATANITTIIRSDRRGEMIGPLIPKNRCATYSAIIFSPRKTRMAARPYLR